jgi:peroxiredoxin
MSIRRCVLPAAVALGLVVGCEPPPQPGHAPGALAPEIFGKTVDGKDVKLSDYRGKVVLVSFWGTWCPPCRDLIPHETAMMTTKYKDRPFTILGVANDDRETLESFFQVHRLPWPNIVDGTGRIVKDWDVQAFPSYLLIDPNGVILRTWLSSGQARAVWSEVETAVKEAEAK